MRVPVADKPWWSAWLIAQRTARGWTQPVAIEKLVAADIGVKPGSYTNWEAGSRKPSPAMLALIAMFYGVDVPSAPTPVEQQSDIDRLIASNAALTHSISLLVNALRPAAQTREERAAALVAQIEALTAELAALHSDEPAAGQLLPEPLQQSHG
jgi:transcriptional regulator with XRE-family HTH domain